MAINFDYDFSGWATKANVKCFDGLTIAPNAFKECDGQVVPVVWNHDHSSPDNVLGHALLQNRKDGVYAYVKMNDSPSGQTAKACVDNGDIDAMSIYANGIQKAGKTVMHGMIKELSLVIAGCNPGALIDEVVKHSADGTEEDSSEAFIYTDSGLSLKHGLDPDDNLLEDENLQHSDDSSEGDKEKKGETKMADANEKTVKQVFDTLTEEQKNVVYAIIGSALDDGKDGEGNNNNDGEEEKTMHHCFENKKDGTVLKHSLDEINNVVKGAKTSGTMKAAFANAGMAEKTIYSLIVPLHSLAKSKDVSRFPDEDIQAMMNGKVDPFMNMGVPKELLTGEKMLAKGTDIGNQLAQNIGITFPYRIDNYCKIVCGMKHQGRYSDDMHIIHRSKEVLLKVLEGVKTIAAEYGLILNEKKTHICKLSGEYRYLQMKYTLLQNGVVVRRIHPKAITRERRKLKAYKRLLDKGIVTMEEIDGYFRSWLSGNYKYMSRDQIYKMNSLYVKLFGRSVTWKKGHGRLRWLMAHPSAA